MANTRSVCWQYVDYLLLMAITGLAIVLISTYVERHHDTSYRTREVASPQLLAKGRSVCEDIVVIDGDTIYATCEQQPLSIRLLGIDAPEMAQTPYGELAKHALQERLPSRIFIEFHGLDYYQRTLGVLYVDGDNVNLALVESGVAVAYAGKDTQAAYKQAEQVAKAAKLGVWAQPGFQQDPKQWRRYH